MSKIKNGGLDQYGAEPFEQQQLEQLALKGLKAKRSKVKVVRFQKDGSILETVTGHFAY